MFVDSVMEAKVLAGFFERGDILYDSAENGSSFPYYRDDFVHHYPGESQTASSTGGQVGDPRWFHEDVTGINNNKFSSDLDLSN